jgi:flagellin-like hook-associated protein FlgL
MIPGLASSGIASAMRTASKARVTMDDMARQIATGQRVSSVKDDGAAWARAAALRSKQTEFDGNTQRLALYEASASVTEAWGEQELVFVEAMRDIYLAAAQYAPGTTQRQTLKAELDQLVSSLGGGWGPGTSAPLTWHAAIDASHGLLAGLRVHDRNFAGLQVNVITPVTAAAPVDTATSAAIQGQISVLSNHAVNLRALDIANAATQGAIRTAAQMNSRLADTNTATIGALTDADLGKASAARAQAETRQQLALSTVRQAISAYSGFATGLLGNVQRTQGGVMA